MKKNDRFNQLNIWTVTKNIKDIKVDKEKKKEIQKLREKHIELSVEMLECQPKIINDTVTITNHDKETFDRLWKEMYLVRCEIENIISEVK